MQVHGPKLARVVHVVDMRVRQRQLDGLVRKRFKHRQDVALHHAGVDQQRLFPADDQVHGVALGVVYGEQPRLKLLNRIVLFSMVVPPFPVPLARPRFS
jgi:hypothetical protein